MKKTFNFLLLVLFSLVISGCNKKNAPVAAPTPTPKLVEIPLSERPTINLTPRADGHLLYLKIVNVPTYISSIEYEVLYTAKDGTSEIEKGLGDTIKEITSTISRDLLLGTESCTNGCKYKYDEGITGGTITLNFNNKNGQVSTYSSPFALKTTADVKKTNGINLPTENFTAIPKDKISGNDYFVLIKQYKGGYSVYSSGKSTFSGDFSQN